MSKLSLLEIKQALGDERFRSLFPEYKEEIDKATTNKSCACNVNLYKKLMKHKDRMKQYFPTKIIEDEPSNWKVINCHIDELEAKLRKMRSNVNIAIARWQDQVTVVITDKVF